MGMVWAIIIILCVAADQLSKAVVEGTLQVAGSISVIDGFFYISNTINKGAAWSFLANKDWGIYILAGISFIASILMIFLIYKLKNARLQVALAFICAGTIGNLIDRVLYKGVTDFIELHFWTYQFPTFNIADSLIVCGTIFLGIVIMLDKSILSDDPKKVLFRVSKSKSSAPLSVDLPDESKADPEQNEEKPIEN